MNGVNWAQKKDALKMRPNHQSDSTELQHIP